MVVKSDKDSKMREKQRVVGLSKAGCVKQRRRGERQVRGKVKERGGRDFCVASEKRRRRLYMSPAATMWFLALAENGHAKAEPPLLTLP